MVNKLNLVAPKEIIILVLSFIVFTIVGTLTHELGHYTMAKYKKCKASINYRATRFVDTSNTDRLHLIFSKYKNEIRNKQNFPYKIEWERKVKKRMHDNFLIILAGPLQTTLFGTFGLILLGIYKKKYYLANKLNFKQWFIIFISLFWLRQAFNFVREIVYFIFRGNISTTNDEVKLAIYLGIHKLSISLGTALIALIVLILIVFKFIPISQRIIFILTGFIGGLLGFVLWFYLLGPILMP